ncbi:helix-turn-helix domain-containing protein [Gilvimarinus sp. F26214L]|uniref:helix-turn-helix domain-containing protein n=1 Tax=Gilvimarinus sp. DZF01 TaxID=3461371 RepID=UPI004045714B
MASESPIGKRLREARTRAGLSQKELGIRAGIDEFSASPRINQYETGKHEPNYYNVARLAKVLNLPPAYFYAEDQQLAELIEDFVKLSKAHKKKLRLLLEQLS